MLQYFTDFQLKTLLNVAPFRPVGSDVHSLFNLPPGSNFTPDKKRRYLGFFDINSMIEDAEVFRLDCWTKFYCTNSLWKNPHAMKETGYREFAKCIEVDYRLLLVLTCGEGCVHELNYYIHTRRMSRQERLRFDGVDDD